MTAHHERERGLEGIARQTLAAREAEQRRIARELHDGPVQSLVLLVRKLDGLEPLVPAGTAILGDARAIAESVTDELRRVSRDLRPSILDDLGLPAALQSLSHMFTGRTGVKARVVLSGRSRRLSADLELTLLRIAEEALRNVERHSGATNVVLRLAFTAKGTRLMIADDGEGMEPIPSPSELLSSNRFGLIGMEERARLAGATLSLRSRPHGGLVVEVEAHTDGLMTEVEAGS
jgi:signal transduction histidine kinase